MSNQLKAYCTNTGRYVDLDGGETLAQLYERIASEMSADASRPICAAVNNKTEDLSYQLFAPKQVTFLTAQSPSGQRVYVRSLCMMLYRAVAELYPHATLHIEHSLGSGYYCRLIGASVNQSTVDSLRDYMRRLVERNLPFERKERLTKDVIELFKQQGLHDKVKLLRSLHDLYTVYYRLDGVCDTYYGNLAPSTSLLNVFDLEVYKEGFLLLGPDPECPTRPAPMPTGREKLYAAFTDYLAFNHVIGVDNAATLNDAVAAQQTSMLINVAEAMHDKRIGRISDDIAARYQQGGARVVLIAGPSSSGKTTFTKRLAIQLMTNLLEPKMISLDDYFVDRESTPRDSTGDYDYESLYALDLETFNRDLAALIAGEEVHLPTYSFELGRRIYKDGNTLRLNNRSVLLIEGIHGLNPELTSTIAAHQKYLIYVSALTTVSIDDHNWVPTTDNRLLRRIIRDYKYRAVSAVDTIKRWPSVRRGEEKWIFPYQENADAMFNSSLIFELGVMKEYAEDILRGVPRDIPEYAEAYRLRRLLAYFTPITERLIPSTSLLREFLGGSSFKY